MATKPRKPRARKASDDDGEDEPPPARRTKKRRSSKKRNPTLRYTLVIASVWFLLAGAVLMSYWISQLPDTSNLLAYAPSRVITLVDAKGRTIARRGLTQGEYVHVGELPDHVNNAFIAIEDRRFRWHFGVDIWGTLRALFTDIREGAFVQGGSTITQQLAKNLFLQPERTLERKIEEAILAIYLEGSYTKDEILTLYLNHVYFGAGVYGIEGAAEKFFNKRAADLTLTEAAILAGIVKAPSRYNPGNDRDAAMDRARVVLAAMEDAGFIDEATRIEASHTRPKIAHAAATPGAGYFVDYVLGQIADTARDSTERLIVETTLDLDVQRDAERALVNGLVRDGPKLNAYQGALVAMTPDGAIRALVGGRSYDASTYDRALAERQPGSAFKPFVFLAALERGHRRDDMFVDGPVRVGKWNPGNYEGRYEGNITLARALARSSNSIAVQLTREAGPSTVARVAHRLGINSDLMAVPALALGTSEVTPLELTGAYAAIANAGQGVMPYAVVRIRTASGKVLYRRSGSGMGRVMPDWAAAELTAMLEDAVSTGTGRAAQLDARPVAGKTGTTQDFRDAWFVGFTADYVCGVWIGNDNSRPMVKATGGGLPARIFKNFMLAAHASLPPRPLRPTLIAAAAPTATPPVASETGAPAAGADKQGILDEFESLLDKLF